MKVYVVVALMDNLKHTQALIGALRAVPTEVAELQLVLVDNGNELTGLQLWQQYPGAMSVITNERNLGVAAAWNMGIRFAVDNGADAVLVAGQDTLPQPGTVRRLVELVKSGVPFVSGTQVAYDTPEQEVPELKPEDALLAAPDFSFFMFRTDVVQLVGNYDANLSYRVRLELEKIPLDERTDAPPVLMRPWDWGLFDSRFFPAYFEDGDYHFRLKQCGIFAARDPLAHFRHDCSLTVRTNAAIGEQNRRTFAKNAELFRQKWGGLPHEVDAVGARPLNVSDEQWAVMSGGREVREIPLADTLAQAKQVYATYGISC